MFEFNTENFQKHQGLNADPNNIKIDYVILNQETEYRYEQLPTINYV